MSTSRNAPCPCGSGRKYKRCCYRRDRAAEAAAPGGMRLSPRAAARAREAERWEADLVPLPVAMEGRGGRSAVALVVAGDVVIDTKVHTVATADVAELARFVGEGLTGAAERIGAWPPIVSLRNHAFSDVLGGVLHEHGCEIRIDSRLPDLDEAAEALTERLLGEPSWPPVGPPETWAGWGLPDDLLADFFRAFARAYRAAPWHWIPEYRPIVASVGDGPEEVVSVLGGADLQPGIVLYREMDDFDRMLEVEGAEDALADLSGPVLFVGAGPRDELPPAMQREVLTAGWEVAAPDAYPRLMPFLTPGGGVSADLFRRTTAVLDALAELVEREADALDDPDPFVFRTEKVELTVAPDWTRAESPLAELRDELANLEFADEDEVEAWLTERFERLNDTPREELSGLTPTQVERLYAAGFEDGSPLHIATDLSAQELAGARFVHNARVMLDALRNSRGTRATQAGNLNRAFVGEMLERMWLREDDLERIRRGNRVIDEHDAWDVHLVRVLLGLAGLIRKRKGLFTATRAGKELAEEVAIGRLAERLFRTFFTTFNLAYLDRTPEEPAFQPLVPVMLWRLGAEAREWQAIGVLADVVLPLPLRHDPDMPPGVDVGVSRLINRLVGPLLEFGLLEEKPGVPSQTTTSAAARAMEVRVTPLFDRMLQFEWGAPGRDERAPSPGSTTD